jgi:hypothetical protein
MYFLIATRKGECIAKVSAVDERRSELPAVVFGLTGILVMAGSQRPQDAVL